MTADGGRAPRTVAEALVDVLCDWNIRYLFGISGANIEHLHDAVHRRGGDRLTSVLAKREDGAAFMADGRARAHRTLGVCCSTSGGAMMNLTVGLAESLADGIPVLAVVGQPPAALDGLGSFQESTGRPGTVDAAALLGAVTKYTGRVDDPSEFWTHLGAAVTAAVSHRPGPVALLIPRDVFERPAPPPPATWPAEPAGFAPRLEPDPGSVRTLFEALRAARRPMLILGPQTRTAASGGMVVDVARRARIPMAALLSNRGDLPSDDPLDLGTFGACGHPSVHHYASRADLVLVAGSDLAAPYRGPLTEVPAERIAVVTWDGSIARKVFPSSLVIEADVGLTFAALGQLLDERPFTAPDPGRYERSEFAPQLEIAAEADDVPADPLLASEAVALLEAYLRPGDRVVTDAGNCGAYAAHWMTLPPGATSYIAFGMGGMGYSVPGAVGVQLGAARGRTMVVVGDGAFLMNGVELHTAVELRLPILYVVFNNLGHGMCVSRQRLMFDGRIEASRYRPPDLVALARACGTADELWTGTAGSATQLAARLAEYRAWGDDRPGVLELRLPRSEVPPMMPFLAADAPIRAVRTARTSR
ncbi:thiamine pyrophosphate-binding protein [Micromonospora sp. NPDC005220]|uniref:thiamine pyrophosphate-binding protein n=1 Tax=Micromonospora sp. NPDC005220 TaxID=3155589 RepID=UPI0033BBEBE8